MPNTSTTNQLPPRTTTSTRWPRKWATIGGRSTSLSATKTSTNDSDLVDNTSKTNSHHRHSISLMRKPSTISRTNDTPIISDENTNQSLQKSRSLMNVIRLKFNSPSVLRRFRSKSRENTKQTVTEICGHTTNQQHEIKRSDNEQTTATTRRSRKRDPSPMRRLANRISQLTKHQRTTSNERQKQPSSKSNMDDLHNEIKTSQSSIRNKDEVNQINACYDEIRAKYYDDINKETISNNDRHSRLSNNRISIDKSLFNDDFFKPSQRIISPISSKDPLYLSCKQSNIKLNCMLNGYNLTKLFANHERLFGQNNLFKYHHYYDIGKRKYDWNSTNNNNRMFTSMRTKPISRSIDSFSHTNLNENKETPAILEKIPILNNEPLGQEENFPNVNGTLPDENKFVIQKYSDNMMKFEQNTSNNSTAVSDNNEIVISTLTSNLLDENNINSNEQTIEEHDEELERNFLRAVNRALNVVNQDQNDSIQPIYDTPKQTDESNLNLIQITKRALSSLNDSPLFTNDDLIDDSTDLTNVELIDQIDKLSKQEEIISTAVVNEDQQEPNNNDCITEEIWTTINDLVGKTEESLFEESKNGQTFLAMLDNEEKTIKSKVDTYNKLLHSDDNQLNEDVRNDINAVIGEVNLLLKGKLKQFRGLCEKNVTKSTTNEPIPLDSDLEGFWDITYPLINKIKEKFAKLDERKAKQWISIEEYDPNDVNNRPRVNDSRHKQIQPQHNKSSKISATKSANNDLKRLIQERRKAAANAKNHNHEIEIFVAPK